MDVRTLLSFCVGWIFLRTKFIAANSGYLLVAPSTFRSGVDEIVSVTILNPTRPIHVSVKLVSELGVLVSSAGHAIFGKGSLKLQVPSNIKGRAILKVCGNCITSQPGTFSFSNSTVVTIRERGSTAFIQLDKPVYKPGQTVQLNIITTKPDLKPASEDVFAYVVDPQGSRVFEWSSLPQLCCGVVNASFPLSDEPLLGTWTVFVKVQGHLYNKTFSVLKYVKPKFEVLLSPLSFIKDWDICEAVKVRARYLFGQGVSGNLTVTVYVGGIGYYRDYRSRTVSTIKEIESGLAVFNVCVSDLMVSPINDHFRGLLFINATVTAPDGSSHNVIDNSCSVNRHPVDVHFSRDSRQHFKPGVPYSGKVLVTYPDGSLASNVTIQIISDVNGEKTTSEFSSPTGEVPFEVPALPIKTRTMWIEVKVIQIDDTYISDRLLSARMSVTNWYSPSKCHILLENKSNNLKPGDYAKIKVQSTCPCDFTFYHEVVSRGNIAHSGVHYAGIRGSRLRRGVQFKTKDFNETSEEPKTCAMFFTLPISREMAPSSKLVVYYVRENGEGVADAVSFEVKHSYSEQLHLEFSGKTFAPKNKVNLKIKTKPDTCVCVASVDKSMHLVKPGFTLTPEKILSQLREFDEPDDTADNLRYHTGFLFDPTKEFTTSKDALFAFQNSGLLVLTDRVSLNHRQDVDLLNGPISHRSESDFDSYAAFTAAQRDVERIRKRKRTFFPDTWIWQCFNVSSFKKYHTVQTHLPDSLTTWVTNAFSISRKHGLALAKPVKIEVTKNFFVDIQLPYSAKRGEVLRVPFTVYSYTDVCSEVLVKIKASDGNKFITGGKSKFTTRFCVGLSGIVTDFAPLRISSIGSLNLSAQAQAFADKGCCSGLAKYPDRIRRMIGHDHVVKKFISEPEGIPEHYTHSIFFCPNERVDITTPAKNEFQFLKKPERLSEVTVDVRTKETFQIVLSSEPEMNGDLLKIVVGGRGNLLSWISKGVSDKKMVVTETPNILSADEYRTFWLTWRDGLLEVGKGGTSLNGTQILSWRSPTTIIVKYIGVSTNISSVGRVKLWKKETAGMYGEVVHLSIPESVIVDSTTASVRIIGDVLGPSLYNLDRLLRLPSGCGEQNLVRFAPAVFILRYLNATNSQTDRVKEDAKRLIIQGYQRQLTYRRHDGSYSAFGGIDYEGSTWLSAFVLKTYSQARQFVFVDPEEILLTKRWIMSQQRSDGSFPRKGRLINKDLQGGVRGRIALTAYVLTSLLESGVETDIEEESVHRATEFLEKKSRVISDAYTASLTAYALSMVKSSYVIAILRVLNQIKIEKDGISYWKVSGRSLQEEVIMGLGSQFKRTVSSAQVEVASYALMTYITRRDMTSALSVVKWLSLQRNDLGGFASTHDTCTALDALSKYASVVGRRGTDLTVTMATTNLDFQEKVIVNRENQDVLQTAVIPSLPTALFVSAVGDGCALLQVAVKYNIIKKSEAPSFKLDVRLFKAELVGTVTSESKVGSIEPEKVTLEVCARWMHAGSSNMAVIDVTLATGLVPDTQSLEKLLQNDKLKLKRYDVKNGHVYFYFDEIPNGCLTCTHFDAIPEFIIGSVRSAPVTVYDYYEPAYRSTTFYNVNDVSCRGEDCPASSTAELQKCECYSDCRRQGNDIPVLGSDGVLYDNLCELKVAACQQNRKLDWFPVETNEFSLVETEGSGEESSGELMQPVNRYHALSGSNVKMSATEPDSFEYPLYDLYDRDPSEDYPGKSFPYPIGKEDLNVDYYSVSEDEPKSPEMAFAKRITQKSEPQFVGGFKDSESLDELEDLYSFLHVSSETERATEEEKTV